MQHPRRCKQFEQNFRLLPAVRAGEFTTRSPPMSVLARPLQPSERPRCAYLTLAELGPRLLRTALLLSPITLGLPRVLDFVLCGEVDEIQLVSIKSDEHVSIAACHQSLAQCDVDGELLRELVLAHQIF